jgi:transposase
LEILCKKRKFVGIFTKKHYTKTSELYTTNMPSNHLKIDKFSTEEIKDLLTENTEYKKGLKLFAVYLVSKGWSARKIGELMDVSFKQITLWIHSFNEEGEAGLEEKPKTGRKPKLSQSEKESLKKIILNTEPNQYGIDAERWKGDAVQTFIKNEYGIDYKTAQIYNIINALNIEYKNGQWSEK